MAEPPALVVCGHGTRDARGRAVVAAAVEAVAARLPGVDVREAYVDVHGPAVDEVVASLPARPDGSRAGVVVPLLLAAGYHVRVDLAEAVTGRPDVVVTPRSGRTTSSSTSSSSGWSRPGERGRGTRSSSHRPGPATSARRRPRPRRRAGSVSACTARCASGTQRVRGPRPPAR